MKKPTQHLFAEVPRKHSRTELAIGVDLGSAADSVAMQAGVHSIWISEQLQELGHEVIVANVCELRAISHSDRKSDQVDAEKLARYARLDPELVDQDPR